jgi:hypothetical protein
MKLSTAIASYAAGQVLSKTGEKAGEYKDVAKEWMGKWWTVPLAALHVGLLLGAHRLLEGSEKLQSDVLVTSTTSLAVAVPVAYLIDKAFHNHEAVEKVFMAAGLGAAAVAGTTVALYANGDLGWNGIESGAGSVPVAEAALIASTAVGASAIGTGIGEAWQQDKPMHVRRG